jgi:hypothetical protein
MPNEIEMEPRLARSGADAVIRIEGITKKYVMWRRRVTR